MLSKEDFGSGSSRQALEDIVQYTVDILPVIDRDQVSLVPNPEHPGSGIILASIKGRGRKRLEFPIGLIDTEGNPYTIFTPLSLVEKESSINQREVGSAAIRFTGFDGGRGLWRQFKDSIDEVGPVQLFPDKVNGVIYVCPAEQIKKILPSLKRAGVGFEVRRIVGRLSSEEVESLKTGEGVFYEEKKWQKSPGRLPT